MQNMCMKKIFIIASLACVFCFPKLDLAWGVEQSNGEDTVRLPNELKEKIELDIAKQVERKNQDISYRIALGEIPSKSDFNHAQAIALFDQISDQPLFEDSIQLQQKIYEIPSAQPSSQNLNTRIKTASFLADAALFMSMSKTDRIKFLVKKIINKPE